MTDHEIAMLTMDATWLQAAASILTLLIAIGAAFSWYETLRSQRSDETVGAAIDFRSAVGRYLSAKEAGLDATRAYDAAWDAQSKLSQTLAVQKRYDDFPGDDITRTAYALMRDRIAPTFTSDIIASDDAVSLNAACERVVARIRGQTKPGIIMRTLARSRTIGRWRPTR